MPLTPNVAWSEAIARSQVATSWQPAAVAMPSTSAMTGFGWRDDRLHQPRAGVEGFLEIRLAAVGVGAMGRHLLQVVAGGEHLARGGDDDDADGLVVAGAVESACNVGHHRQRQRVGRRIGERDAQDAVFELRVTGPPARRASCATISAISVSNPCAPAAMIR